MSPLPEAPVPDGWAGLRVAVVVAHPDDEVLACGALLGRLRDVRVVHVTDGAPRDGADAAQAGFASPADYAARRRAEAIEALALAGMPAERLTSLGVPDQGAAHALATLALRLEPILVEADLVLTHAFEGGHPDHDAVAFAVHAASDRRGDAGPIIVEMPFYFGDEHGWVRQRFLEHPGAGPAIVLSLSDRERALKARMVEAHATQAGTLAGFALDRERFRSAPRYDFIRRPHHGPLLYERHGWGLTWPAWVAHIVAAQATLRAS